MYRLSCLGLNLVMLPSSCVTLCFNTLSSYLSVGLDPSYVEMLKMYSYVIFLSCFPKMLAATPTPSAQGKHWIRDQCS